MWGVKLFKSTIEGGLYGSGTANVSLKDAEKFVDRNELSETDKVRYRNLLRW